MLHIFNLTKIQVLNDATMFVEFRHEIRGSMINFRNKFSTQHCEMENPGFRVFFNLRYAANENSFTSRKSTDFTQEFKVGNCFITAAGQAD